MPQAYSPSPLMTPQPLSPSPQYGSPYIHSSLSPYDKTRQRYPTPQYHQPKPKRFNDLTALDPLQLSDYILKVGPQGTSPIIAKLVLNNHVDGRTLMESPVDVIESISGVNSDARLRQDFLDVTNKLRAATAKGPARDVRMSARLIALELAAHTPPPVSPVPSVSHSDDMTPPLSPSVPEWDFDEGETVSSRGNSEEVTERERPIIVIDTTPTEPIYEPLLHIDQPTSAISASNALSPLMFPSLEPSHVNSESANFSQPSPSTPLPQIAVESDEEVEETETETEMMTADDFESSEDEDDTEESEDGQEDEYPESDTDTIEDGIPDISDEEDSDEIATVDLEEDCVATEVRVYTSNGVQVDDLIPEIKTLEVEIQTDPDSCPRKMVDFGVDTMDLQMEEERRREEENQRKAEAEELERRRRAEELERHRQAEELEKLRQAEEAKRRAQERLMTLERRWQEREKELQEDRRRKELHEVWEKRELRLCDELTRDPPKRRRMGRTARQRQKKRTTIQD